MCKWTEPHIDVSHGIRVNGGLFRAGGMVFRVQTIHCQLVVNRRQNQK